MQAPPVDSPTRAALFVGGPSDVVPWPFVGGPSGPMPSAQIAAT
ncbi:hypothetical protein GLE_3354 [Lysobacter enzymogenes]|uniref:Uncharacterized protein n=1 Tax=Lysobacter enzymogenes TaxID=69 RepID=A0A0S2DJI9_LYSEN|nr:hypothetical protein GLE_3354 [Lysobacter enzymogenes]